MYVFIFSLFEYILASIRDFFAGLLDAINTGYEESFKQLSESFADEIDDPIAVDSIQFLNTHTWLASASSWTLTPYLFNPRQTKSSSSKSKLSKSSTLGLFL